MAYNDEKNNKENGEGYDEEDRIAYLRQRRLKREKERKKRLIKRVILLALAAIAIVLIIWGAGLLASSGKGSESNVKLTTISTDDIKHLSFAKLSVNSDSDNMSADEFKTALQQLYDEGYCLCDIYDIAKKDESGNMVLNSEISFPEGKKPLILSQRDVCYPLDAQEKGIAEKMLIKNNDIVCQYTDASGQVQTGDFDVVPIVESFIKEHPDFSYNNARGILSFSGYCGVLGYRTSSYLASADSNAYASYGTFDTASETSSANEVIDELKSRGWRFASAGFSENISYGSEYSIVEADAAKWQDEVASVIGSTDMIIFPNQTDIASWKQYSDDNRKYALLKEEGFTYFFINDKSAPYMTQSGDDFFRQTIYEINSNSDFALAIGSN